MTIEPTLPQVSDVLAGFQDSPDGPNLVPLCASYPADLLTPSLAYLKIRAESRSGFSFLFESAETTETIARYSFLGASPRKIIKTGPGHGPVQDPLPILAAELAQYREAAIPGLRMPPLAGGAIGYVGYDCVRYFEPRTARPLKDVTGMPEAMFMLFDTIVAFDHFYQVVKVISYLHVPKSSSELEAAYNTAAQSIHSTLKTLTSPEIPSVPQKPIKVQQQYVSNIGRSGFEAHVRTLRDHIIQGDIIQAVPSQRFARHTDLHPFNLYRHLRTVNPSPYLFYIECPDFALVGASPELLVKAEPPSSLSPTVTPSSSDPPSSHGSQTNQAPQATSSTSTRSSKSSLRPRARIVTHPIAGTVPRGPDPAADARLAAALMASLKDRAEHVMLVDLARNDVNRVCEPLSTRVDYLMAVQRFSHVQHLTSQVSGTLRPECSRYDAFRSLFPAGTVSGAPKVRAMELIAELEGERRGVYAGAVGYWGYDRVYVRATSTVSAEASKSATNANTNANANANANASASTSKPHPGAPSRVEIVLEEGAMDTCIALRTMVVAHGVAYLQAGAGIVFDSDPYEEWVETINKLGANVQCIEGAEARYAGVDRAAAAGNWRSRVEGWDA